MRAFFALNIDPAVQYAIEKWRDQSMPLTGRPVPAANFHVTLNFLGNITPNQLDRIFADASQIHSAAFDMSLDTAGYFPRSGVFWIGADDTPASLLDLVKQLRRISKKAGIRTDRKAFEPHVTLLRKCQARPPWPVTTPVFELHCNEFVLFESITNHKGVRYQPVCRWPLN